MDDVAKMAAFYPNNNSMIPYLEGIKTEILNQTYGVHWGKQQLVKDVSELQFSGELVEHGYVNAMHKEIYYKGKQDGSKFSDELTRFAHATPKNIDMNMFLLENGEMVTQSEAISRGGRGRFEDDLARGTITKLDAKGKIFEWDDLRIFLAIQRGKSVRAASKLLKVSHSTVSRRLQAMEDQLGIQLFVRQPEGFVLTEVGEAMVERAERVESEILSMESEIFGRDARLAGPVRISAPPLLAQHLLIPILAKFSEKYPDIEINLDATFDVADLRRRNADIAIRFQIQPDSNLVAHRLPDFANSVYATPDYISGHSFFGQSPSAEWIALSSKEVLAHWRQATPYSNCKVRHIISDMLAQLNAVKASMGFAHLFCFLADKEPLLARLPKATTDQKITAWALTHPDMIATERVRVCVKFLVDEIFKHEHLIGGERRETSAFRK